MKWSGFLYRACWLRGRCGGRDLAARRVIDEAVYDLRLGISEAATKVRISALNPHWTTTHVDHVEMTDEGVADSGRPRRPLHRATA